MSDVSQGGATVFPNVGARIPPGNVRTFYSLISYNIICMHHCRVMQHSGGTSRDLEKETIQHDMQLAQY